MAVSLDGRRVPIPQNKAELERLLHNPAELQRRIAEIQKLVGDDVRLPKTPEEIAAFLENPMPQVSSIQAQLGERLVVPPEAIQQCLDPATRQKMVERKKQWDDATTYLRIGGLAAIALAIGLTVLAVFTLLSGGAGIFIGITLIAVSLPLFYAGYNCFMVSRNMEELSQNMLALAAAIQDMETLKTRVCKNTIVFECVADKLLTYVKV